MKLFEEFTVSTTSEFVSGKSTVQSKPTVATVANIAFHDVTMEETVGSIVEMVKSGNIGQYVCTGNLDHLLLLQKDELFRSIYAKADLVVADGMPVVWLSRLSGETPLRERVAGSDLFWQLARVSHKEDIRLFFLGGSPGAAERAAENVRRRYPDVKICGIYCPPHEKFGTPEEEARIQATIKAAQPDILLVGFGAPKQEKWIVRNREILEVPVCIGVGGTFEMAGGIVRTAPKWVQRSGMEWLYRMAQDPRRLWRRYIAGDLPFFVRLYCETAIASARNRKKSATPSVMPPAGDLHAIAPKSLGPRKRENKASLNSMAQ
jgi:N-acetylglucosaminyldiphosphoundecaprenol N-acetyl-beta-D-mannosaminyltransferase